MILKYKVFDTSVMDFIYEYNTIKSIRKLENQDAYTIIFEDDSFVFIPVNVNNEDYSHTKNILKNKKDSGEDYYELKSTLIALRSMQDLVTAQLRMNYITSKNETDCPEFIYGLYDEIVVKQDDIEKKCIIEEIDKDKKIYKVFGLKLNKDTNELSLSECKIRKV